VAAAGIFTASDALALHMVDRLGYLEDAFLAARELAGVTRARLVAYREDAPDRPNVYSLASLAASLEGPAFLDRASLAEALDPNAFY